MPDSIPRSLNYRFAKLHQVLLSESDQGLIASITKQTSLTALLEINRLYGSDWRVNVLSTQAFNQAFTDSYQNQPGSSADMAQTIGEEMDLSQLVEELPETKDLLESDDDAPIIKLLNAILNESIRKNASDIHIETFEEDMVVRFRIDGVLQEVLHPQRALAPLIISRIKVMAKLDIAEKRLPQDGRMSLRIADHPVDVRVSTIPTGFGERIVLRILDKKSGRLDLNDLGMAPMDLSRFSQLLSLPHGIILVTGPTGSGKTTSLYAGLTTLNDVSRNILTVEDPIEYYLPGIGQTQVNTKVDMTFAKGLRAILRQDPDVVMVGEIRDLETAEIAVQASLTGHLVLSTLHTNSAIGVVMRLRDMGVEPYLIAVSLVGIVAQRLVRILCEHCRKPHVLDDSDWQLMKLTKADDAQCYEAVGCEACHHTGYVGRCGIYEVLTIDDHFRQLIHDNASEAQLREYAQLHFGTMRQDGFAKVLAGRTTIEEVLRVTAENQ